MGEHFPVTSSQLVCILKKTLGYFGKFSIFTFLRELDEKMNDHSCFCMLNMRQPLAAVELSLKVQ